MSEFCPENVNRSDATGASEKNVPVRQKNGTTLMVRESLAAPASVAPQEEWTVEPVSASNPLSYFYLNFGDGKRVLFRHEDLTDVKRICATHNSALREKEKEMERLRGEIQEWRKRCERFRNQ